MALNHRLNRLERTLANAPMSPARCALCGIAHLKDGAGVVRPGWRLPERIGGEAVVLGCKSCFAWVRMDQRPSDTGDGGFQVVGATPCGPPEYI